ncbi:hypothetical protein CFB3_06150 [Clostridium folliculivorans]|nr:hypothetical protein CFB3_06150 [Clostridium folliculivorans]
MRFKWFYKFFVASRKKVKLIHLPDFPHMQWERRMSKYTEENHEGAENHFSVLFLNELIILTFNYF